MNRLHHRIAFAIASLGLSACGPPEVALSSKNTELIAGVRHEVRAYFASTEFGSERKLCNALRWIDMTLVGPLDARGHGPLVGTWRGAGPTDPGATAIKAAGVLDASGVVVDIVVPGERGTGQYRLTIDYQNEEIGRAARGSLVLTVRDAERQP